jgi:hypothetical protein
MTDDAASTNAAATPRAEASTAKSGYRAAPVAVTDTRNNGGSGVQRSHLRNRKAWLKERTRAGQTWSQRKVASATYCPAKVRAG